MCQIFFEVYSVQGSNSIQYSIDLHVHSFFSYEMLATQMNESCCPGTWTDFDKIMRVLDHFNVN